MNNECVETENDRENIRKSFLTSGPCETIKTLKQNTIQISDIETCNKLYSIFSPFLYKNFHLNHDFHITLVRCQISILKDKWYELSLEKKICFIKRLLSFLLEYHNLKELPSCSSDSIQKNVKDIFFSVLSLFSFKYPFMEFESILLNFISLNEKFYYMTPSDILPNVWIFEYEAKNRKLNLSKSRILSQNMRTEIEKLFLLNIAFPEAVQFSPIDICSPELTSIKDSFKNNGSLLFLCSVLKSINVPIARHGIYNEISEIIRAITFSDKLKKFDASCILLFITYYNMDSLFPTNKEISTARCEILSSLVKLLFTSHITIDDIWVKATNLRVIVRSFSNADDLILTDIGICINNPLSKHALFSFCHDMIVCNDGKKSDKKFLELIASLRYLFFLSRHFEKISRPGYEVTTICSRSSNIATRFYDLLSSWVFSGEPSILPNLQSIIEQCHMEEYFLFELQLLLNFIMKMAYLGTIEDDNQIQLLGGTLSLFVGCPEAFFSIESFIFWSVFLEPVSANPDAFPLPFHSVVVGFIMNITRQILESTKKSLPISVLQAFLRYLTIFVPLLTNIKERSIIISQITNDISTMITRNTNGEEDECQTKELFILLKSLIQFMN